MRIETFPITPFQQNTRVVICEDTGTAVCIDPGEKCDPIVELIKENGYQLQAITLTHGHLDHAGGTIDLHRSFPEAAIILHKDDEDLYYAIPKQPLAMGVPPSQLKSDVPSLALEPSAVRGMKVNSTAGRSEVAT